MDYTIPAKRYIYLRDEIEAKELRIKAIQGDIYHMKAELSDISFKKLGLIGHKKVDDLMKQAGRL